MRSKHFVPATAAAWLAVAALTMSAVRAAGEPAPYEFRRAGAGLACILPDGPDEPAGMRGCLRVGPLRIGMSLFDVSRELGTPDRVVERDGVTLRVYAIPLRLREGESLPYWVVGFRDGTVTSIQLTGEQDGVDVAFSSIRLGDPKVRVVEILGEPHMTRDVDDVDAEFWGYAPFPISFEIKNGRVYSIRIADGEGR